MSIGTAATIGVGVNTISSALSFAQAAKQSSMASKARKASEKLVADARKKAEKDYYEGLNVPLDAYGEQFAQNMANQQQTIQALQEGDTRNLIGGVQGLTAAAAAANEQTRIGLGQELYANRKMKADSRQNINQQQLQIDIGQATDQQLMARDAEEAKAAAMQSGIYSAANAAYIYGRGKELYGDKGDEDKGDEDDGLGDGLGTAKKDGDSGNTKIQEEFLNRIKPKVDFEKVRREGVSPYSNVTTPRRIGGYTPFDIEEDYRNSRKYQGN
tara:strand:+ start:2937 stop:3749 length:813 start_codon:yes stop_codon:yes gene_type:complete